MSYTIQLSGSTSHSGELYNTTEWWYFHSCELNNITEWWYFHSRELYNTTELTHELSDVSKLTLNSRLLSGHLGFVAGTLRGSLFSVCYGSVGVQLT